MPALSSLSTRRFIWAALVAAPLALTLPTTALAKAGTAIVRLSGEQFVANCQSMGGTSSVAPGGGIRCVLPSGTVIDCSSMGNGEMVCQWNRTLPTANVKQLMGDPLPNRVLPDKTPSAPKLPTAPATVN